jgi:hypothetical protein
MFAQQIGKYFRPIFQQTCDLEHTRWETTTFVPLPAEMQAAVPCLAKIGLNPEN